MNSLQFYQENSWYISIANSLSNKSDGLDKKIDDWQAMIKQADTKESSSPEGERIKDWYRRNNKSYHSSKLRISDHYKDLIQKFSADEYYIFKNIVEILGRQLVSEYLSDLTGIWNTQLKTYITSDFDDVAAWVDLIVEMTFEDWVTQYLWLDIAVTSNDDYLWKKEKRTQTYCIEFNLANKFAPKMMIDRKVLKFHPKVMWELIYRYLSWVEKGQEEDILELFRKINKRFNSETAWYGYIQKQTSQWVNNILTIE